MNFPLLSEYIEAIRSADDTFERLSYLMPVLSDDGLPVMTSGNFAVVFKMKDKRDGKLYAVKCFTKEQERRAEAYKQISEELKDVKSPYLTSVRYFDKELFVDTKQTKETEFPVLLMDWVEGKTLDKYLRENLEDKYALEMLAYRFSQLAQWLIAQPFAHGDLKPDNIIVREDGTLVLVDYDGMYVPAMKGQKARELGSPDFRHPLRTENDFDEHIDDFPLLSILLSLKAISLNPSLLEAYGATDRLLFSERDYNRIDRHEVIRYLFMENDASIKTITSFFISLCYLKNISIVIPVVKRPYRIERVGCYDLAGANILSKDTSSQSNPHLSIKQMIDGLLDLCDLMEGNSIDFVLTGSLGLYIHGMTPDSYSPHDIDIIIVNNHSNHPALTNEMILNLFVQYSGGKRPKYGYYSELDLFVFYIGSQRIEINAFYDRENVIACSDYKAYSIMNRKVYVKDVLSILKEKYKLCRLKDYQFNVNLQIIMNSFFIQSKDESKYIVSDYSDKKAVIQTHSGFFSNKTDVTTIVTQQDIDDSINFDGVLYSSDKKRLLRCKNVFLQCIIKPGTIVIGDFAFYGCDILKEITIPSSVLVIGKNPFYLCTHLRNIICQSEYFVFHDDTLFSKDMNIIISCISKKSYYDIPNHVTRIEDNAFSGLTLLKGISLVSLNIC